MRKNKIFISIFIFLLSISFMGCAALQRKFVRKKKEKEEKAMPIITTFDYSKDLRVEELYKKHYLYWQSWQTELIERLDAGHKKRISCYDYTMKHLLDMEKYLTEPKMSELGVIIREIKDVDIKVKEKNLSKNNKYQIKRLLEKTLRQIQKRFSYGDVKDHLEIKK
ncbi:hypothetical protein ACFL60_08140 [Candidatus Omnitrophota bacterium]